jgi:hypothetical protein
VTPSRAEEPRYRRRSWRRALPQTDKGSHDARAGSRTRPDTNAGPTRGRRPSRISPVASLCLTGATDAQSCRCRSRASAAQPAWRVLQMAVARACNVSELEHLAKSGACKIRASSHDLPRSGRCAKRASADGRPVCGHTDRSQGAEPSARPGLGSRICVLPRMWEPWPTWTAVKLSATLS